MITLKRHILSFFLLIPAFCVAEQIRDFSFYKDETTKLLTVLKLDPTTISFVEATETPTIKQREDHPHTIFLNTNLLNAKPLSIALFSCAVEAKLGTLSAEQWKKITE